MTFWCITHCAAQISGCLFCIKTTRNKKLRRNFQVEYWVKYKATGSLLGDLCA